MSASSTRPSPLYSRAKAYHVNESALSDDVILRRKSRRLLLVMLIRSFENADVRQVAVGLGSIEPVSDHEVIFDREAEVFDGHRRAKARRLVQKRANLERARQARAQELEQVRDGQTGVDDVLDEEH